MKSVFLLSFVLIFLVTSNAFGSVDFTFSNIKSDDFFGHAVELIGDLDGDGVIDIAVGAPYDNDGANSAGAVHILFLNSDGTVKSSQKISSVEGNFKEKLEPYDAFGRAVTNLGDFDGDGVTDIAVGAYHDDDGGYNTGAVYILFLNSDGTVKSSQKISSVEGNFKGVIDSGDCWGNAITVLNDLDGDGVTDIAVGAHKNYSPGSESKRIGAVHILFLNSDGTVKSSQEISDTEGNFKEVLKDNNVFGIALTNLNDLDGDGVTDIAVGAFGDNDGANSAGAVYILFLNSDGTVKSSQKISSVEGNFQIDLGDNDRFGYSIDNIGDLNNDNIIDIAVGAPGDDDARELVSFEFDEINSYRGAVYILFLNSDGTVKSSQKISSAEGNFKEKLEPEDSFGFSLSKLGDLNGDGVTDIAVGSPHRYYSDSKLSPLHILFLNSDGKVISFETIPKQYNVKNIFDGLYFLLIILLIVIISVLLIIKKFKLKNATKYNIFSN